MARRHRHEEHQNHERWVISFADMMTLLFALFVVLYSLGLDKLDPVARSIAFAFHFEGDGKTKMEGIFDQGQLGGGLLDGPPLINSQSGAMKEWLQKTLAEEFEEVSGSSLEVVVSDDSIAFKSKLSAFFVPGRARLKPDVQNLLNELFHKSTQFANQARLLIEAPDERVGRAANGVAVRTDTPCLERLRYLMDLLRTQPVIEMHNVRSEFQFLSEQAGAGAGSWEDRAVLTIAFSNSAR